MRKLVSQERVNADPRLVELQKNGWTIYDVNGAIMPEYTGTKTSDNLWEFNHPANDGQIWITAGYAEVR